jgi:hypothetical protein|tara:strand:- start:385 stop:1041 length:657 start_codon:yes stop_codon:yes gene_type:complete
MSFNSYFLCLVFTLLNSCSSLSLYRELADNFSLLFNEPVDLPLNEIDSIPYASIQARIGRSQNALIVLEDVQDNTLKWTSSNLVKIYTINGYVVKLTGLENELDKIDLDPYHPAYLGNFDLKENSEFTSFYTFNNPKLFRLPVKTSFKYLGEVEIILREKKKKVRYFEEKSLKNLISWDFTNKFWVDEKGYIVKSEQIFTPKNPEIHIKLNKKYKKPE